MVAILLEEVVQKGSNGHKPAVLAAQSGDEFLESSINGALLVESTGEVGVDDTGTPLLFELVLICLGEQTIEVVDPTSIRGSVPIVDVRSPRIMVGHPRAGFQGVDLGINEISQVGDFIPAKVAPEIFITFDLSAETIMIAKSGEEIVGQTRNTAQTLIAPVDIFGTFGMI